MSKMVQIRNVPDEIHLTLKQRAAAAGMTLSDYLLAEVTRFAELPTIDELSARIRTRPAVKDRGESPAAIIRRIRDASD
jgi:plasmid stability protein